MSGIPEGHEKMACASCERPLVNGVDALTEVEPKVWKCDDCLFRAGKRVVGWTRVA